MNENRASTLRDSAAPVLRPGFLVAGVVALFTLFPNTVVRPKFMYAVEGLAAVLLLCALVGLRAPLRWSFSTTMTAIFIVCSCLSVGHYGQMSDLIDSLVYGAFFLVMVLAASNMGRRDRDHLIDGVLIVAAVELVAALAEQLARVPAPWGYLGRSGATFGTNDVLTQFSGRATGTMGHPIPLGTMLASAALLALFARPSWHLGARLSVSALFVLGVLAAGSRAALIALILAGLVGLVIPGSFRNVARVRLIALLLVIVGVVFADELSNTRIVSSLSGTGSTTHRLANIGSVPKLLGRPLLQSLFGSGHGSVQTLFSLRLLQLDNFMAIDDQLVSCLAIGGVIGALAILALVGHGLLFGDRLTRSTALLIFVMFLSFDLLEWYSTLALFAVFASLGSAARGREDAVAWRRPPDTDAPPPTDVTLPAGSRPGDFGTGRSAASRSAPSGEPGATVRTS